jgi:hypothetical protein
MERLDLILGLHPLTNHRCVVIHRCKFNPVSTPRLNDFGCCLRPLREKLLEKSKGSFWIDPNLEMGTSVIVKWPSCPSGPSGH